MMSSGNRPSNTGGRSKDREDDANACTSPGNANFGSGSMPFSQGNLTGGGNPGPGNTRANDGRYSSLLDSKA